MFNLLGANPYAFAVGLATIVTGLAVKRYRAKWPHLILAVLAGSLIALLLDALLGSARTEIDKLGTISLAALPFSALVGIGLVKPDDIKYILRVRGESRIVFLATLATTLFSGLNNAVFLGIAVVHHCLFARYFETRNRNSGR